jgi:hypothetical protein
MESAQSAADRPTDRRPTCVAGAFVRGVGEHRLDPILINDHEIQSSLT